MWANVPIVKKGFYPDLKDRSVILTNFGSAPDLGLYLDDLGPFCRIRGRK